MTTRPSICTAPETLGKVSVYTFSSLKQMSEKSVILINLIFSDEESSSSA